LFLTVFAQVDSVKSGHFMHLSLQEIMEIKAKERSILCIAKQSENYPGGETGIRTLGTLAGTTVFETAPFNHSGISPV
jgi:hypothetical protein